ncbi:F-box 7 [Chlorella sorokiniana]|uniref:F-box 7 n=1 Tax=Chlorella sorokiniana TaxID=3076 RepID=A0A2P6TQ01_CHLSO|nr:F-box 7 [Chlorella sorokiniana]|eukprot:PRW56111.1 F-box 7 [Chlorella sorokiniana]
MAAVATERYIEPSDNAAAYIQGYRPWMSLLGVRLRHGAPHQTKQGELALIEQLLPEELLLHIFERLPIIGLATAQLVCRQWRRVGAAQPLWRRACMNAFFTSTPEQNAALVRAQYRGCWKRMLMERPHLRFDGIYVSRNTYLRMGVVEWKTKSAAHLVLYFRYFRFFPDGTFAYRTSPEPLSKVHRSLAAPPKHLHSQAHYHGRGGARGGGVKDGEQVFHGRFKQDGERVWTAMRYDLRGSTEVRSRLRLRSTVPGANNRLDIQAIVSWDREDRQEQPLLNVQPDEEAEEGAETRQHRRGMVPYVFVPFEQVHSHVINLPVSVMDCWITG